VAPEALRKKNRLNVLRKKKGAGRHAFTERKFLKGNEALSVWRENLETQSKSAPSALK